MYFRHNEDKSVVITERFIKTLKAKIYKNMTTDDSKSYRSSLNKLVDQYYNTYHQSVNKKPINAGCFCFEIETNLKAPTFKLNDRVRITKHKKIFSEIYTENWSREIFFMNSVLKSNTWTYKIKYLKGDKIIGGFYEK